MTAGKYVAVVVSKYHIVKWLNLRMFKHKSNFLSEGSVIGKIMIAKGLVSII